MSAAARRAPAVVGDDGLRIASARSSRSRPP